MIMKNSYGLASAEERIASFRIRLGAIALAVAGVLFVLYPALRPFSDETSLLGAEAFGSADWMTSHVMAILAFVLLTFGFMSLNLSLQGTAARRLAFYGLLLAWLGIGLTLPYYGAEVYGLSAIGQEAVSQQNTDLMGLADDIRFGPGFSMILVGLVLLAIGAMVAAAAVWRSRLLSKWSAIPIAVGFLLYLPQYLATQPVRVAHGLLITVGCLWLAASMWQRSKPKAATSR
ncbi:hypothetical protein D3P08_14010 [Paenibacillus nanensis]|uniref:DUF998 domain-containing protein n=1 Tax=Paenibacillus nanensis TaxID=393251 RepID=A0A3A1UU77_9BACL|nr:hypothetical protein [Paenibacillus nanensis]RIX52089.1 hypothetical protein D3P08_14010 [Paenibacillus nanensis]